MDDKCPVCNEKMFDIYFNSEGRYQDVQYKRCLFCNRIECNKTEEKEEVIK